MDKNLFDELTNSLEQAGEIMRGERPPSRAFELVSQDVRAIRERLRMSQEDFAGYLEVRVATVRNWEQGRRIPRGPARRLLELSRDRRGMLFDRPTPGRTEETEG